MAGRKQTKPHVNDEDVANEMECLEVEVASWWDEVNKLTLILERLPATGAAGLIRNDAMISLDTLASALMDRAVVL